MHSKFSFVSSLKEQEIQKKVQYTHTRARSATTYTYDINYSRETADDVKEEKIR